MQKVIIIGAGGTGLAAGMFLAEAGKKVELYDAAGIVGGLAASETADGMYFDYGPHIYHTHDEQTKKFWKERFGDLLKEMEFYSQNYTKGVFYDYPLSYETIDRFPPELRDRVKKELNERTPEKFKRAVSFKECLVALLGPTLEEMFFDGYSAKLWGLPTDQMAASWAPKRIEIRKEHKSFWYNQYSASPVYGSGKIMERMADRIRELGGVIHLNHRLTGVDLENSRIRRLLFGNGAETDVADAPVISTIPITELCAVLGIHTTLEFTSYILVYLIFKNRELFPPQVQTLYFSDPDCWFHRATEQRKYSDYGYPPDKTLLCFEISRKNKPFLESLDDDRLVDAVAGQFCSTGLAKKEAFIKGFTRRVEYVNPIMRQGYEQELARVKARVSGICNLHCVGGAAEFKYGDLQVMFSKARDIADLLASPHYQINRNVKTRGSYPFNPVVTICGYPVGGNNPTLVVAELGLNHNGDVAMGRELIRQAKLCGADMVKLQTWAGDSRVSESAKGARYADKTLQMEETSFEMFRRLRLSYEDHIELFEYAKQQEIPIISTPFDEKSVDLLVELGIKALKIASFDLVNIPLLRYAASKGVPLIVSTGMASLAMVEDALDAIAAEENPNVILLHCVSAYPAGPQDSNLRAMETMRRAFNVPVGFSDHTVGSLVSIMAMTLGAHLLEKHFTLDTRLEGTDHVLSLDPPAMRKLCEDREAIFSALGTGVKRPAPSEYEQINAQRKSIFTTRPVAAGEPLTLDNITIKGPGHGLLPRYFPLILGKKAARAIAADAPVTWDDLLAV